MRQRDDVAVARAIERVAQIEAEPLDGGERAEWPLLDYLAAADDLPIVRSRKYWASAVMSATSWKWKLTLTIAPGGRGAVP